MLRNIRLHGERNHRSTNLNSFGHLRLKIDRTFGKNESSKLGKVIFEVEATVVLVVLHQRMATTHGDVRDSHITLVASSEFEHVLFVVWHDEMDHSGAVLLKSERLEQQEVFIDGNVDIN